MKHRRLLTFLFCAAAAAGLPAEERVPLSYMFRHLGTNALHSVTCNYGLNFIGAGLGTWAFIETGLDWQWNRLAWNHDWMPRAGEAAIYTGYGVPVITPLALYVTGRLIKDEKLQITALALAQTLMLTLPVQSSLKAVTGRTWPGLINGRDSPLAKRSGRTDNYSA